MEVYFPSIVKMLTKSKQFGMGSRTCIGKNISLLEMSKLVPQLIRNFDISLERPNQTWEVKNRWFVKQKQYFCRIQPRASLQAH